MARGKKWSDDEDQSLATSYVSVSVDPKLGADQKAVDFWSNVLQHFRTFQPGTVRTVNALYNRWKDIHTCVGKFAGYYDTVKSTARSGWSEEEYYEEAQRMYGELEGDPFTFFVQWQYLREKLPTFAAALTPSSKRSKRAHDEIADDDAATSSLEESHESPVDLSQRPMSSKKAKALAAGSLPDKAMEAFVHEPRERNKLLAEQNRIAAEEQEIALFSVDTSTMDDVCRQYFEEKRAKVMEAMLKGRGKG
ncbi:No apical meristem-associated C-terminal domain-containing protein [Plasmodiophora brassicae]|uniref:No apical meristem-associated C-terminal domain-containing protein n=1 Tax=Plasmodiophora brassicae TaxID=37360 RepID=A0A0G4J0M5_PLABS|nr:hypothetical protein PBRA_008460 [Plasmodiophora brassicae]SPQ99448.1 unnamed protein product [Plasmodiophora brassicae]